MASEIDVPILFAEGNKQLGTIVNKMFYKEIVLVNIPLSLAIGHEC